MIVSDLSALPERALAQEDQPENSLMNRRIELEFELSRQTSTSAPLKSAQKREPRRAEMNGSTLKDNFRINYDDKPLKNLF